MSVRCRICSAELCDPLSVKLGIGPVCRVSVKSRSASDDNLDMFEPNRPDYLARKIRGVLVVVDLDRGNQSVTNGVEVVLRNLVRDFGPLELPVIFKDSMRVYDGIDCLPDGTFIGFYSLALTRQRAAIYAAKKLINERAKT